jgi:hypothetical protein
MRREVKAKVFCPSAASVDKRQLAMGIKVELEHTRSRATARCIALVHLHECPTYYSHLRVMEKKCKRGAR